MKSKKRIAQQIAEHFGWDVADVREYEYQAGCWSRKVYAGFDDDTYWSAGGAMPPRHKENNADIVWQTVASNYPGNGHLWVGRPADQGLINNAEAA